MKIKNALCTLSLLSLFFCMPVLNQASASQDGEIRMISVNEAHVISLTADKSDKRYDLSVTMDQNGDFIGFSVYVFANNASTPERSMHYTSAQLSSGIVLLEVTQFGITKTVVSMKLADDFNSHSGGKFVLTLLREYSLFGTDDDRNLYLELKQEAGKWAVYSNGKAGHQNFDAVVAHAYEVDGSPKGIGILDLFKEKKQVESINTADLEQTE